MNNHDSHEDNIHNCDPSRPITGNDLSRMVDSFKYACHACAVLHGFYDDANASDQIPSRYIIADRLLLIITELGEGYEALRCNRAHLPDEHCPEFTNEEVEVADAIIRLLDFAEFRKLRLGAAIVSKFYYNQTRPYKHGKQF
jgi:hypothetical protein